MAVPDCGFGAVKVIAPPATCAVPKLGREVIVTVSGSLSWSLALSRTLTVTLPPLAIVALVERACGARFSGGSTVRMTFEEALRFRPS